MTLPQRGQQRPGWAGQTCQVGTRGDGGQGAVEVEEEGGVSAADLLDYGAELLQGMGKTIPGVSARYLHIRYLLGV